MKYSGRNNERMEYRSVSGAWIKEPKYYCTYHKSYLTDKQAGVHHCFNKHNKGICYRLYTLDRKGIRVNNEQRMQSYMEKMLHKLTNIDMNVSKLLKQINNMQNKSKEVDMKSYEDDGK